MFARLVPLALFVSIVVGGFAVDDEAQSARVVATTQPIAATPVCVEPHNAALQWEFIRNSAADEAGKIAGKPLLRAFAPCRAQPASAVALIQEQSRNRPTGLILLCERAQQLRSGVLRA